MQKYYGDYPKEPIGGNNPYQMCSYCHVSVPEINGDLEGHREWCEYRRRKTMEGQIELLRLENECLKLDAQAPIYAVLWHWSCEGAGSGVDDSKMKLFRNEKGALDYQAQLEGSEDFDSYYHEIIIRPIRIL